MARLVMIRLTLPVPAVGRLLLMMSLAAVTGESVAAEKEPRKHFLTFQVGHVGSASWSTQTEYDSSTTQLNVANQFTGKVEVRPSEVADLPRSPEQQMKMAKAVQDAVLSGNAEQLAKVAPATVIAWFPVKQTIEVQGQISESEISDGKSIQYGESRASTSHRSETYRGQASFEASISAQVKIHPDGEHYDIDFSLMPDMASTWEAVTATIIEDHQEEGNNRHTERSEAAPLDMGPGQLVLGYSNYHLRAEVTNLPLTNDAGELVGSARIPVPKPERWKGPWDIALELSWQIDVSLPPVELVITAPGYERWLPKGSINQPGKVGNDLQVRATVVSTDEDADVLPKIKSIQFELLDTSREPGVCLNWPLDAKDKDPDLRLAPVTPGKLSDEDQKFVVTNLPTNDEQQTYAEAQIECFDFGAHATLRATCELANGRKIVGHLKQPNDAPTMVPIPRRRSDSKIARVWADRVGLSGSDSEDLDAEPVGDGNKGDGFSNYEEYRGFVENGLHLRTKPKTKDLFIRNKLGARALPGIFRYADNTHLAVHYELRAAEMPATRAMNANRSDKSPRSCAPDQFQHGLILDKIVGGDASITDITGDLWRPEFVSKVRILWELFEPGRQEELASTIAHELLHATGVRHHGERDDYVVWLQKSREVDGQTEHWFEERPAHFSEAVGDFVFPSTPGTHFRMFTADGREVPAAAGVFLPRPQVFFLGHYFQQHSGDVNCVMRYHCAQAFVVAGRPRDRFLSPGEPSGTGICSSSAGTGFNAPGAQPIVRYATASSGNCAHQFCVRDDGPQQPIPR